MSQYFPEPYECFSRNVKVQFNLPNYVTKADLKRATGIDTYILASKTELTILRTNLDNLNVDQIKAILADFSKLSNAVNNNFVKKAMHK